MPKVTFLSVDDQKPVMDDFNRQRIDREKIPLVNRNFKTGWPLLQVSLMSPVENKTGYYEPALGGGKCHYFDIGAFNLGVLLSTIHGKMEIRNGQKTLSVEKLSGIALFLDSFDIHHIPTHIRIRSSSGSYGKILTVESCGENLSDANSKLAAVLADSFRFSIKKGFRIHAIGSYHKQEYPEEYLERAVKQEVAVFSEGQIFVDLGALLSQVKDEETSAYFRTIFRVDEFLEVRDAHPELLPSKLTLKDMDDPYLVKLHEKIKAMSDYGRSMEEGDIAKAKIVQELAKNLEEKVLEFYKNSVNKQPNENNIQQFKGEFKQLLHSQDNHMQSHRKKWKPIVANILFCFSGIGLMALALKAGQSAIQAIRGKRQFTINNALFFAKTNSEKKIQDIDRAMDDRLKNPDI
jgi:hypothetical protein